MIERGVPAARIETVLNGTIGTMRAPAGTPPAPVTLNHPNVVTVAGMYARKGIADLIEATAMVRERVPTVPTNMLGDGPDRAHFEQLARDRGIGGSVVFLGFRADAGEEYKVLAVNGVPLDQTAKPTRDYGKDVAPGVSSRGVEYISAVADVFKPESEATFKLVESDLIQGRRT